MDVTSLPTSTCSGMQVLLSQSRISCWLTDVLNSCLNKELRCVENKHKWLWTEATGRCHTYTENCFIFKNMRILVSSRSETSCWYHMYHVFKLPKKKIAYLVSLINYTEFIVENDDGEAWKLALVYESWFCGRLSPWNTLLSVWPPEIFLTVRSRKWLYEHLIFKIVLTCNCIMVTWNHPNSNIFLYNVFQNKQ